MPHSCLGVVREIVPGHVNFDKLGVTSLILCQYACRTGIVVSPPSLADRLCRDGVWILDGSSLSHSCPNNVVGPIAHPAPPPLPPAAPVAAPSQPAAPAPAGTDGDWTTTILRAVPEPFSVSDFVLAIQNARTPNATEVRLDESRNCITSRINDHYTNKIFEKEHWTPPREVFDSLPKRLSSAAGRRIATSVHLLLALASTISASPPLKDALGAADVVLTDRFPGVEVIIAPPSPSAAPAAPPSLVPREHPSVLHVIQAVTALLLEADGLLLETAHLPNATRAAELSGTEILQGTVNKLKEVKTFSAITHAYTAVMDADETADLVIRCRSMSDTLLLNPRARLSLLYRTPTMWPPRKRLMRLHWRHFWHAHTLYCDDAIKSQATLQAALNVFRKDESQLSVLRAASAASAAAESRRNSARSVAGDTVNADGKRRPPGKLSPAEHSKKRKSEHDAAHAATSNAVVPAPTGVPGPSPLNVAVSSGALASLQSASVQSGAAPFCKIDTCPACKATRGISHVATCSWVAGIKARGGSF